VTRAARVAVIGAGWAGLAAAIDALRSGAHVTLFEMAAQPGGRARDVLSRGEVLDNGQHICIGAYTETLRLLRDLGVDASEAFLRRPLALVDAEGKGLRLRRGPTLPAFAWATLGRTGWRWRDRLALLAVAARWRRSGFRCAPHCTVADLSASLPSAVFADFIEPLCVAALNTPAAQASGTVFLRVLRDALTGGPGSADLLLPRRALGQLLPGPALARLQQAGAEVRLGTRVEVIRADGTCWAVDQTPFDRVIVAASANEAARLLAPHAAQWAACAAAFAYQPIVTVYARSSGCRLPEPMLLLAAGPQGPAQFVFDRGQLGGPVGLLAFVVSGAREWLESGALATEQATLAQATAQLQRHLTAPLEMVRTLVEKRATFACTPMLVRPPMRVAAGLFACGDYIEGPYPATLEGAVRSGLAASRAATT
jgi:squalene-associated FAD-dependent desaturase